MKHLGLIIFACIIFVVIVIVLYYAIEGNADNLTVNYLKAKFAESPWDVYNRSIGTFDDAAELALERARGREYPTAGDHILAATIIFRNILTQEHKHILDINGNPTPESIELSRIRRTMFNDAQLHYNLALRNINTQMRGRIVGGGNPFDVNTIFIIDEAAMFANNGITELLANDGLININEFTEIVDTQLISLAERRRSEVINNRVETAISASDGVRSNGVQKYTELATQNTNDPQNTHDSSILANLRAIVERLREDQHGLPLPTLDNILAEIKARGEELSDKRAHRIRDVSEVIARMSNGERVIAIGATDGECLQRVWLRITDSRNIEVKNKLRQSVFDALYDCWEDGMVDRKIVCVNGRTARVLASLILIDWDERNWVVKKLEQYKNDIFAKTAKLIKSEAALISESADAEIKKAALTWTAETVDDLDNIGDVSELATEQVAQMLKDKIREMVLSDQATLDGMIPSYMIDSIIKEAQAAVY